MSRSYKKSPICKDKNPWEKNYANRIIRHGKNSGDIPNGGYYKKYYCSYNICDYSFRESFESWKISNTPGSNSTKDSRIEYYWKHYYYWK